MVPDSPLQCHIAAGRGDSEGVRRSPKGVGQGKAFPSLASKRFSPLHSLSYRRKLPYDADHANISADPKESLFANHAHLVSDQAFPA